MGPVSDSLCIWFWIHLWLLCIQRPFNAAIFFSILSLSYWPHTQSWSRVGMVKDKQYEGYDHTCSTHYTLVYALCLIQRLEAISWHDGLQRSTEFLAHHNISLFNLQMTFLVQRLEAYETCSGSCVEIGLYYSPMPEIINSWKEKEGVCFSLQFGGDPWLVGPIAIILW